MNSQDFCSSYYTLASLSWCLWRRSFLILGYSQLKTGEGEVSAGSFKNAWQRAVMRFLDAEIGLYPKCYCTNQAFSHLEDDGLAFTCKWKFRFCVTFCPVELASLFVRIIMCWLSGDEQMLVSDARSLLQVNGQCCFGLNFIQNFTACI